MPESVEIPAPVSTTTRRACSSSARPRPIRRRASSSSSSSVGPTGRQSYGRSGRILPRCPRDAPTVELLHAADAEDRQRRTAGALLARGCTRGDRVAFALGSSADLICAVLGAARVGLIPVLLNATLTTAERDQLAADARPAVRIFTTADLAGLATAGAAPAELAPIRSPAPCTTRRARPGGPRA